MEEAPLQHWYALKVFYNKVFEMESLLQQWGMETYLAVQNVRLKGAALLSARKRLADVSAPKGDRYIVEGAVIYARKPLVTSLLFVQATEAEIKEIDAQLRVPGAMKGIKGGFVYKTADFSTFSSIPAKQMEQFRLVVESGAGGLEFFADDDYTRYKEGSRVRVTSGPMKGAEGYIKRIRRDRRLLVCIEGIIAVATSYIPPEQLEIIS